MDYRQRIRDFLESNFIMDDTGVQFDDEDNYFALGFVNSLFAMKLIGYIENEFKITVGSDDLDIRNFSSVNNIIDFIGRKKSA